MNSSHSKKPVGGKSIWQHLNNLCAFSLSFLGTDTLSECVWRNFPTPGKLYWMMNPPYPDGWSSCPWEHLNCLTASSYGSHCLMPWSVKWLSAPRLLPWQQPWVGHRTSQHISCSPAAERNVFLHCHLRSTWFVSTSGLWMSADIFGICTCISIPFTPYQWWSLVEVLVWKNGLTTF